ncbi:linoleate diol synthase [Rhizoctonia solani AG-1 IA]|uniref:Linoleate diol synthase n=1 Tax=Thanatephorus cucumeris (strain AG1-IA) TaxID=983506 RepID=L8WH51_THACA|nr:linoleate diol synthase [Rhizoctonia solani AG-1 IA]
MSEPGLAYRAVDASLGALSHLATSIDNSLRPVTANANAYSRDPDQEVNAATAVIEGFRRQYSVVDAIQNSKSLDDRKMLLEHALVFMSRLPRGSALAQKGQDAVISMLYKDLPHPPATYVGDAYRFRAADGGNNNLLIPDLGRAGTPYSRSVPQTHPLPPAELPDPELVFECLLKRDKVTPHPAGLSAMFFSFATLVIHTCFRTNHRDVTINETSSYVDLAPLYGNNQEDQDSVRRWDGTGRLKEDVFTENRLLFLPPVSQRVTLLTRRPETWQFIARKLFLINEEGTFRDPETLKEEQRKQQDHVLFNTARLINVGFFVSIVLGDYLASILGIVREGSDWSLNPFQDIVQSERNHVPRGEGNSVSVEFNLLYHWHSTTSAIDEQWTEGVFRKIFGDKPFEQITPGEFAKASALVASAEPDKAKWEFGGMKRGSDGRFNDAELAQTIINATSHVASAFKARGTPPVLRVVEILGIMSSRKWGVCSLNEFRKFIGLKPYDSFTEWNSDPEIATAAMRLYKHPDNLELYVGLQAEEAKPVVPGAGLCPGYTISRAILSDAITLTRGDPHTANNLTCWGFDDATRDTENPSFGGMLGKLFYRTLPGQFPENSIYLWFPLMTPDAMKTNFTKVGIAGDYDFSRPTAPQPVQDVTSRAHVMDVIMETACIHTPYGKKVQAMFDKDPGFFLALNDEHDHTFKTIIYQNLIAPSGTYFQSYFYEVTKTLLQDMSYTLGSHQSKCLDIVDVFENVVMRFVSEEIGGLSLKSESNPRGLYFERCGSNILAHRHVFTDVDIQHIFRIAKNAKSFSKRLLLHINQTYIAPITERIFGFFSGTGRPSYDFMRRLHKTGKPKDQLCKAVLAAIVASFEYVPALINVVNFYLDPAQAEHKTQLVALASSKDPQANNVIAGYVREFSHARRVVVENTSVKGSNYKRGDSLFLSIADSNLDPDTFPNPKSVDPRRPADSYTLMGDGLHRCFSDEFVHSTMACAVRAVFQLNNIRRGPGKSGILKRFTDSDGTTASSCYLNSKQIITPFPTSLTLQIASRKYVASPPSSPTTHKVENKLLEKMLSFNSGRATVI